MAETTTTRPIEANRNIAAPRYTIYLIGAAVVLFWTSLYLYVPTLPVYARSKTQNLEMVGVILSMYGLWQGLLRLPLGIATDWLGKRKGFILLGFGLSALGALVMASAHDANGLVVGRAITGLAAATWVPIVVLFSSLFPPKEAVRATAILSVINSVGCMLGSSLNGSLNRLGGYPLAFFAAIGVAGVAALIFLTVREPILPRVKPTFRGTGALITRRDVLLPALLSATSQYISWTTTFGFLPILAKHLGASGELNSLLVTINLALSLAGNLVTTAIVRRTGNIRMIYLSYVVIVVGIAIAALAASIPTIVLAQVVIGLGNGMGYPLFMGMSIEKVDQPQRATAMGLHQAVYSIGMFAGPWLSGILADAIGIQPMFGVTAGVVLVVSLGLASFLKR
ncbi:MAG TPA: MFS transporter [Anaerolineaceae bacterium]